VALAAAPSTALPTAFVTAAIGGLLHAVLSGTGLPAAGPSSATAQQASMARLQRRHGADALLP
jgi:hypothetical protein